MFLSGHVERMVFVTSHAEHANRSTLPIVYWKPIDGNNLVNNVSKRFIVSLGFIT